jgi:hypothetical protein
MHRVSNSAHIDCVDALYTYRNKTNLSSKCMPNRLKTGTRLYAKEEVFEGGQ